MKKLLMQTLCPAALAWTLACVFACAGKPAGPPGKNPLSAGVSGDALLSAGSPAEDAAKDAGNEGQVPAELSPALEELAELERSGGFVPGLGLAESNVREQAGDYAGAVLAVYKELSWAYGLGSGGVSRETIAQGLGKLLDPDATGHFPARGRTQTEAAVRAILAFFAGNWKEAASLLEALYGRTEDDSFSRWMLMVCEMEASSGIGGTDGTDGTNAGNAGASRRSSYGAIRARYGAFPEYWYRGARNFPAAAGEYAERCINLSPSGPYAAECRAILAAALGLEKSRGPAIRTRREIEGIAAAAAEAGDPGLLAELLPLAALPDNPSTLYAAGVMRALAGNGVFRDWFIREAEKAGNRDSGRLAERLRFISRGS